MAGTKPLGPDDLCSLKESDIELENPKDDWRGRKVYDSEQRDIGRVGDLIVDVQQRKTRFLHVHEGGFMGVAENRFLVPVDEIATVSDDAIHLNSSYEKATASPLYDPELVLSDRGEYWDSIYDYWGHKPYWSPGYVYPLSVGQAGEQLNSRASEDWHGD